jgi:tetratricopeptide (TPR) repeat protein
VTSRRTLALVLGSVALALGCSSEAARQRHFAAGERFLESRAFDKAIIEFRNALSYDGKWGTARHRLAEALAGSGQPERALTEYLRAADLLPDDVPLQLKAASFLLLGGNFEDVKFRVERILKHQPENVDALILLGNALAGLKDLPAGIAQITDAAALDPTRADTYLSLATLQAAAGDHEQARSVLERAVATDPASVNARLALAHHQWALGDVASAQTTLEGAHAIDPKHVLTNHMLGAFLLASGKAAEADPYLTQAAALSNAIDSELMLADYYISQRRFNDARRLLEPLGNRAIAASPATTRLATLEYAEGRHEAAHRMLDGLLTGEPRNAHAMTVKARWLLNEGHSERAMTVAREATAANTQLASSFYVRGLAEVATRRLPDAMTSFGMVLQLNPHAAQARVQISRLHLYEGAIDSAVLAAEEAVRSAPGSLEARLALIRAWIARKDYAFAEPEMAMVKKAAPSIAAVHALDGTLNLQAANYAAARAAFVRALQADRGSLDAIEGLTWLDERQNALAGARRRLEEALAVAPREERLLYLAARIAAADGDAKAAEALLRRTLEVEPLQVDAYSLLGKVLGDQGRLQSARLEFNQAAAKDARDLASVMMAALLAHALGDIDDALARYAKVLEIEPRAALAANNLAWLYADARQNLDLAQQLAETASRQWPSNAGMRDTLGWVYYQRQLASPAVRNFERAVALDPKTALYHYHLGLAHRLSGDAERSRQSLQTALQLEPNFTDAAKALEQNRPRDAARTSSPD